MEDKSVRRCVKCCEAEASALINDYYFGGELAERLCKECAADIARRWEKFLGNLKLIHKDGPLFSSLFKKTFISGYSDDCGHGVYIVDFNSLFDLRFYRDILKQNYSFWALLFIEVFGEGALLILDFGEK